MGDFCNNHVIVFTFQLSSHNARLAENGTVVSHLNFARWGGLVLPISYCQYYLSSVVHINALHFLRLINLKVVTGRPQLLNPSIACLPFATTCVCRTSCKSSQFPWYLLSELLHNSQCRKKRALKSFSSPPSIHPSIQLNPSYTQTHMYRGTFVNWLQTFLASLFGLSELDQVIVRWISDLVRHGIFGGNPYGGNARKFSGTLNYSKQNAVILQTNLLSSVRDHRLGKNLGGVDLITIFYDICVPIWNSLCHETKLTASYNYPSMQLDKYTTTTYWPHHPLHSLTMSDCARGDIVALDPVPGDYRLGQQHLNGMTMDKNERSSIKESHNLNSISSSLWTIQSN